MNQLQTQWLEALRSGIGPSGTVYQQGTGVLKSTDNKFCCLGVLCDIVDPTAWKPSLEGDQCFDFTNLSFTISDELRSQVGLDKCDINDVIAMNDGSFPHEKQSFSYIADFLEEAFKLKNTAGAANSTTV